MKINKLIQEFTKEFSNYGSFELLPNESINEVVVREKVPDKYGVYLIYGIQDNFEQLIYLGKSGTIKNDGKFKDQALRKRLTMKQDDMRRKDFFKKIMKENNYDRLKFLWFITYDDDNRILPGYAEGKLVQAFVENYKRLPLLNKSY
jgi:hypothetical protein